MHTQPTNRVSLFIVIIGLLIIGAAATRAFFSWQENATRPGTQAPAQPTPDEGVACTMDARICPDGSAVGRSGPNCEFDPCPSEGDFESQGDQAGWVTHTVPALKLTFKAPPTIEVTSDVQNNDKGELSTVTLYIQKGTGSTQTYYQLYGIYQTGIPYTAQTLQAHTEELQPGSTETTVSGYPAVEGQIKGQRNRFVTYIFTEQGRLSLFTSEPTEENRKLSEQIISTFTF